MLKTYTPNQLEQILKQGFDNIAIGTPENLKEARAAFAQIRAGFGFSSKAELLTKSISKLQKNKQVTAGLALMPASASKVANLCAFAGDCASSCVAYSGNGGFSSTQKSRTAKVNFMIEHPEHFALLLFEEIRVLSNNNRRKVAIRLNTYSDIRWERVAPILFDAFSRVSFYDYTKHPMRSRPVSSLPANYSLTYSVSEKTTEQEVIRNIDSGRNLAVVVAVRSGEIGGKWRKIDSTWRGIATIDGDMRDDRHNDAPGKIVILRRKHTLKISDPLITHAANLEKSTK